MVILKNLQLEIVDLFCGAVILLANINTKSKK